MIEKIESCSPRRKWRPSLLKMGSWEPQENASKDGEKGGTSADRIPDARYPRKVEHRPGRIPDVRHPGRMLAEKNSGCETSGVEC